MKTTEALSVVWGKCTPPQNGVEANVLVTRGKGQPMHFNLGANVLEANVRLPQGRRAVYIVSPCGCRLKKA